MREKCPRFSTSSDQGGVRGGGGGGSGGGGVCVCAGGEGGGLNQHMTQIGPVFRLASEYRQETASRRSIVARAVVCRRLQGRESAGVSKRTPISDAAAQSMYYKMLNQ